MVHGKPLAVRRDDEVTQRGHAAQEFLADMAAEEDATSLADIPARVCVVCAEVLSVTDTAVMLMAHPDDRHTLQASSMVMVELEELQYTLGEGPSMEAFASGRPMIVPDIAVTDMRWPMFSSAADRQDIRGVFGFPLQQGGVTIGVLSLARRDPGGLTDDERVDGLLTADAVALVMLRYLRDHDAAYGGTAHAAGAHMWDQMTIDQAIGMVMAQLHSDATRALTRLRATAFARGQSLTEIAGEMVNGALRFDPEPPEPGGQHRPW